MKTLHIVRHGKSLRDPQIQDDDRPLTVKGIENTISVAEKLLEQYQAPDVIVSSYASRALHTAHIFARIMGFPHENVQANEELYLYGNKETAGILENMPDNVNSVMIVGHNPDMTYVANWFAAKINEMPTSSVVTVTADVKQWSEINKSNANCSFIES